jgi:hypothetical protein
MTDLLEPTGRATVSLVRRGAETHVSYLWIADGQATRRLRALNYWLLQAAGHPEPTETVRNQRR